MTMVMIEVASPMLLVPLTAMTMVIIWSEWPRPWRWSASPQIRLECHFVLSLLREELGLMWEEREKKSRPEVRGERKPNKKHYFGLSHLSVPLQICNGTNTNGIILAHMQHLMGAIFYVWCGICAKYLAFGTYLTSTVGALRSFKWEGLAKERESWM